MPLGQRIFSRRPANCDILCQSYDGSGTGTDPFLVKWVANDPTDPQSFSKTRKWAITFLLSLSTLSVALASSAYTSAVPQLIEEYDVSAPTAYLGVSLFVVCFAVGPLVWASLCEIMGRQIIFITTFAAFTAFSVGAACSKNIESLLVCRFFAGAFGSSSLVNTGGVLADIFSLKERGPAMSIFTASLFFGPTLGPIIGSFIEQTQSWRWIEGFIAIMSGVLWITGSLMIPETYSPVLLQRRAHALSRLTSKVYRSKAQENRKSHSTLLKDALIRPWCLLFLEPVVILVSTYLAIVYGILYLLFAAFPVVYREQRGWKASIASLPFLAVLLGMSLGVAYCMIYDHQPPARGEERTGNTNNTTRRLQPAIVGAIAIPIGLFTFSWTNHPSIHFIVSCIGSALFGFGLVNIFISMSNYLVDTYSVFAASSLAASSVLRSILGAVFPLFTPAMYQALGIHWASSIPSFLSLACVPIPFCLWRYHVWLGSKSRYIIKAREVTANLRG
ncbi:MFS transporter [Aspergillus candidus]|uniref:Major facilitator superfamily domain-containing protein n=1 Tax=Aspergillus candidus TaxID=41067 RepID=A0A2I2FAL0_ASPCN|nr:major facilitator superfamily domain-containing protein [Aspergillus candidus]PLB37658.1 major facilitator superfamily domain-containing protein [Aspergillus candidus]